MNKKKLIKFIVNHDYLIFFLINSNNKYNDAIII